ncbi:phenylacetaldoxime dehydratase family protein [Aquabacter spiritensis]|uniref:Phenylacetaldoxime dehydratase/aldoxime dehydratase n=1 Tax=Aquabacter spiritensis TaxID=933073 RepID=A0A4R3LXW9_9HYPH|nr:phenylacetaldoxime dehydratase family protein [Aquabacter spiritensis]TCT05521.1 phenylacetaldoxime dehydratase/aldoxime dehydratase [Aquabacter spiritensis]
MGMPVYDRVHPLRKPKGFEPVVQRWSTAFPNRCRVLCVAFHGIQGASADEVYASPFFSWLAAAFAAPDGPTVRDDAAFVDRTGLYTHIVAAYWVDEERRDRFFADPAVTEWWEDRARLAEPTGYFRESLTVPVERQESIYWLDYPGGLSASADVALYPTPWCGYYGAMRDRIPLAAVDTLDSPMTGLVPIPRETRGARWQLTAPHNLAVIRSAASWGRCDPEQAENYMRELRAPLMRGMDFLKENSQATGCASLRFQQTCGAAGAPVLETHALGYFLSLGHLEAWAEHHPTHDAIFTAAIARYRKYGKANQLRTWHEVFILPDTEKQVFDYLNCAPGTGLLDFLPGTVTAVAAGS